MSRPIRILELRSVRGTGGGPEKTILAGAARADHRRFEMTVCYIRDNRDPIFLVDKQASGLPLRYVEVRERHSFDPSIWPALRRLVREGRIDIVHSHEYKTDLLAWCLGRTERVGVMSTVHGWTGHSLREQVYYWFDKRLLARFDRAIAVSRQIKNELLRWGAADERVAVVPNGIDHEVFRRDRSKNAIRRAALGFSPDDFIIGAVGRLEPQKRFDLLIDAFAELHRRHPQLRLMIVGEGSLRHSLQEQLNQLGLMATCKLLGHDTDIIGLHHAFDLFVQASDYEGTPNAVLEAMALETPLVATDAGGTAELIRHGVDGLIVASGHAGALATAIESVLADGDAAARRAASARERVENDLSFAARMSAVEAIYEDLFRSLCAGRSSVAVHA